MTSDLCSDDVVVCIASPQMISTEGEARSAGSRVAASSAAVELGRRLLLAARAGDTALVLDLLAQGAPFTTDWLGTSPLHLAASNNHLETCAVLLRVGVSRDARTKVERTPLHMAAYAGHADVVTLLLQHHAAPDCRDMLRMTPLHWAAQRGHAGVVAALLAAGACAASRDKFGSTPRDLARRAQHRAVLALLDGRQQDVPVSGADSQPVSSVRRVSVANTRDAEETDTTTQGFQTLHRLQEINIKTKTKPQQDKPSNTNLKAEPGSGGDSGAAQLLRRHGITLLPADDGSTVLSALQSGRTVVLSDAGKLMLKESSPPAAAPPPALPTPAGPPAAPAAPPTAAPAPPGSPPGKGLKLVTLNNKLLLPHGKLSANMANVQLSQVKFVQLKDKLSSPLKARRAKHGTPVKIIVNKNNYKLLNNNATPAIAQTSTAGPPLRAEGEAAALRAQLAAARKAIAALTAELACCKARLAQLEQRDS